MFAIMFSPFGFVTSKTLIFFGFPIFRFWAYLMNAIPETRRVHKFEIYAFITFVFYAI